MFSELIPGIIYNISIPSRDGQSHPLASYLASGFGHIPYRSWAAFAYSISFTAFCFIPVWILYRKKIFLKV
jgi:hypothetical protein